MANAELAEATKAAEFWGDEVKDAQDKIDDAQSAQEKSASDLETAQKRLTDATKALSKARADKNADPDSLETPTRTTPRRSRTSTTSSPSARTPGDPAHPDRPLFRRAAAPAVHLGTLARRPQRRRPPNATSPTPRRRPPRPRTPSTRPDRRPAYAQKIASAAMSGSGVVDLFPPRTSTAPLRFARAAYESSVALGKATTDASNYQAAIDQVAAAGAKLATAQAAGRRLLRTQKATLAATRAEVDAWPAPTASPPSRPQRSPTRAVRWPTRRHVVGSLQRQLQAVTVSSPCRPCAPWACPRASWTRSSSRPPEGPGPGAGAHLGRLRHGPQAQRPAGQARGRLQLAGAVRSERAYALPGVSTGPKIEPRDARPARRRRTRLRARHQHVRLHPGVLSNGEYVIKAAAVSAIRPGHVRRPQRHAPVRRRVRRHALAGRGGPRRGAAAAPQTVNTGPIFNARSTRG